MESGDSEPHVHLHTGHYQVLDNYVARSTFSSETGAGLLESIGLGHNKIGTQRDKDTAGLGHNRTWKQRDCDTTGLGNNRTGAQQDWGTTGLGLSLIHI